VTLTKKAALRAFANQFKDKPGYALDPQAHRWKKVREDNEAAGHGDWAAGDYHRDRYNYDTGYEEDTKTAFRDHIEFQLGEMPDTNITPQVAQEMAQAAIDEIKEGGQQVDEEWAKGNVGQYIREALVSHHTEPTEHQPTHSFGGASGADLARDADMQSTMGSDASPSEMAEWAGDHADPAHPSNQNVADTEWDADSGRWKPKRQAGQGYSDDQFGDDQAPDAITRLPNITALIHRIGKQGVEQGLSQGPLAGRMMGAAQRDMPEMTDEDLDYLQDHIDDEARKYAKGMYTERPDELTYEDKKPARTGYSDDQFGDDQAPDAIVRDSVANSAIDQAGKAAIDAGLSHREIAIKMEQAVQRALPNMTDEDMEYLMDHIEARAHELRTGNSAPDHDRWTKRKMVKMLTTKQAIRAFSKLTSEDLEDDDVDTFKQYSEDGLEKRRKIAGQPGYSLIDGHWRKTVTGMSGEQFGSPGSRGPSGGHWQGDRYYGPGEAGPPKKPRKGSKEYKAAVRVRNKEVREARQARGFKNMNKNQTRTGNEQGGPLPRKMKRLLEYMSKQGYADQPGYKLIDSRWHKVGADGAETALSDKHHDAMQSVHDNVSGIPWKADDYVGDVPFDPRDVDAGLRHPHVPQPYGVSDREWADAQAARWKADDPDADDGSFDDAPDPDADDDSPSGGDDTLDDIMGGMSHDSPSPQIADLVRENSANGVSDKFQRDLERHVTDDLLSTDLDEGSVEWSQAFEESYGRAENAINDMADEYNSQTGGQRSGSEGAGAMSDQIQSRLDGMSEGDDDLGTKSNLVSMQDYLKRGDKHNAAGMASNAVKDARRSGNEEFRRQAGEWYKELSGKDHPLLSKHIKTEDPDYVDPNNPSMQNMIENMTPFIKSLTKLWGKYGEKQMPGYGSGRGGYANKPGYSLDPQSRRWKRTGGDEDMTPGGGEDRVDDINERYAPDYSHDDDYDGI
jgi:hypothetical protein